MAEPLGAIHDFVQTTASRSPSPQDDDSSSRPFSASLTHRSNPNFSKLPPLITSHSTRSPNTPRPLSQFFSARSHVSGPSARSRPQSNVFPVFHSSPVYTNVRDFFYPIDHQLHYGPPVEGPTKTSTPVSGVSSHDSKGQIDKESWAGQTNEHSSLNRQSGLRLPATSFGDGPPWSEDEDLLSPIVTSSKSRREKSSVFELESDGGRNQERWRGRSNQRRSDPPNSIPLDEIGLEEGVVAMQGKTSWQPQIYRSSPSPETEPVFPEDATGFVSDDDPTPYSDEDEKSRYSRDYQFTIASPDEEMHGKAVALYDFTRENENELPLLEGQVLWVSYRHGQGWLVAQDPKSGEKGLVPEEYVRLVRDIEGGLTRLNGGEGVDWDSPTTFALASGESPRAVWHERSGSGTSGRSGILASGQHYTPVVSHFSTSSKDLEPYPQRHLFGGNVAGGGQTQPVPSSLAPGAPSPTSPSGRLRQQAVTPGRHQQYAQQISATFTTSEGHEAELASSPPVEAGVDSIHEQRLNLHSELPLHR